MSTQNSDVPNGWFPDPSGARGWRQWTHGAWQKDDGAFVPYDPARNTEPILALGRSTLTMGRVGFPTFLLSVSGMVILLWMSFYAPNDPQVDTAAGILALVELIALTVFNVVAVRSLRSLRALEPVKGVPVLDFVPLVGVARWWLTASHLASPRRQGTWLPAVLVLVALLCGNEHLMVWLMSAAGVLSVVVISHLLGGLSRYAVSVTSTGQAL